MNGSTKEGCPPGYELFFALLQVVLDPTDYERVHAAYIFSKFGHSGQSRRDGTRFFDHPKGAAWIYMDECKGIDPRLIIDLLLHDLAEDTYLLSPYRISLNFGKEIALDVRALTKLPDRKETTEKYMERVISRGPWAIAAKLFDRLHNLRTMNPLNGEERTHQIVETGQFHLPYLIPALRAHKKQWEKHANALECKIAEAIEKYA